MPWIGSPLIADSSGVKIIGFADNQYFYGVDDNFTAHYFRVEAGDMLVLLIIASVFILWVAELSKHKNILLISYSAIAGQMPILLSVTHGNNGLLNSVIIILFPLFILIPTLRQMQNGKPKWVVGFRRIIFLLYSLLLHTATLIIFGCRLFLIILITSSDILLIILTLLLLAFIIINVVRWMHLFSLRKDAFEIYSNSMPSLFILSYSAFNAFSAVLDMSLFFVVTDNPYELKIGLILFQLSIMTMFIILSPTIGGRFYCNYKKL